jgi:hypothetical protein
MLQVASGVTGASPIWRRIILDVLSGKPDIKFTIPSGIVTASVDSVSGYRAHDGYPSRTEYFIKGTEPGDDPVHTKLKVCKSDGKLAAPSDIASGNFEEKEFFVFREDDPTAGPGEPNRWQEGIAAWLSGQTDSRYHPPADYCGSSNPVSVEFESPGDHTSNLPNAFKIKIRADSTADIVQVELEIDGSKVRTFTGPPFEYDANLSSGVHTLKAKAKDANAKESDRTVTVGVNVAWDFTPSPTFTPTPTP